MKKITFLLSTLMSLTVTGCNGGKPIYDLIVEDYFEILQEEMGNRYREGNVVDVYLKYKEGDQVAIRLNGELWAPRFYDANMGYALVSFKMPGFNSKIQTTIEGAFKEKCPEGEHNFVKKHYESMSGEHDHDYMECTECGYYYIIKDNN